MPLTPYGVVICDQVHSLIHGGDCKAQLYLPIFNLTPAYRELFCTLIVAAHYYEIDRNTSPEAELDATTSNAEINTLVTKQLNFLLSHVSYSFVVLSSFI